MYSMRKISLAECRVVSCRECPSVLISVAAQEIHSLPLGPRDAHFPELQYTARLESLIRQSTNIAGNVDNKIPPPYH